MATEKQIAANRRNAQKCTGPKTDAGKFRSSRNALKHGTYARKFITTVESDTTFLNFTRDILDTLNPTDSIELQHTQDYIEATWQAERLSAVITDRLNSAIATIEGPAHHSDTRISSNETNSPDQNSTPELCRNETNSIPDIRHAITIQARAFDLLLAPGSSYLHLERLRFRFRAQAARATSRLFQYRTQKCRNETNSSMKRLHLAA